MILNGSSVFGRSFYLSTVPGVSYKEGIPEGHRKITMEILTGTS